MHIVFFTECYDPVINGVVTSIKTLRAALQERGHRVTVVAPSFPGYKDEDAGVLRAPSLPSLVAKEYRVLLPHATRAIRKALRPPVDVVHTHHPFLMGRLARRLAGEVGAPLVFTHHTQYEPYAHYVPLPRHLVTSTIRRIVAAFCDTCDLVLTPGSAMKRKLEAQGVNAPVEVFPTWIELPPGWRDVPLAKLGLPPGARICLYAGRLAREKNIDFLLDAFSHISDPSVWLVLAGGGPDRAYFERVQRAKRLKNVRFLGMLRRSRVLELMRRSDLFVFSSLTETQGIAVLEAMYVGLPVIALEADGIEDMVSDGVEGYLCPPDPRLFAAKVLELLENDDRRRQMSQKAQARAREFSKEGLTEKLLRWYEALQTSACGR